MLRLVPSPPPKRVSSHVVLVLEPDDDVADACIALATAAGMTARRARNATAALEAARGEGACAVLLGPTAIEQGGEAVVAAVRALDVRRNGDDRHVLPVLFLARRALPNAVVSALHEHGADGLVPWPIEDEAARDRVVALLLRHLRAAGRERHAACASLAPRRPDDPEAETRPPGIALAFTTQTVKSRTVLRVGKKEVLLPNRELVVLLVLAARRLSGDPPTASLRELTSYASRDVISRTRRLVRPVLPKGAEVVTSDYARRYALGARLVPEVIPWKALEKHPSWLVRETVAAHRDDVRGR